MCANPIWLIYKELVLPGSSPNARPQLSLRDYLSPEPQNHEEEIARYLESAPAYSGVGKIVGDALNPDAPAVLFPGNRTDGLYVWQSELSYYVRKYHLRVPSELIERMSSLNWQPPAEQEIDWQLLHLADIHANSEM
jgi:hypothetical protein